jgi:hypothetical protein
MRDARQHLVEHDGSQVREIVSPEEPEIFG